MSNKKLVETIIKNSITAYTNKLLEKYKEAHYNILKAEAARLSSVSAWEVKNDYKAITSAARKKNATEEDKKAAEKVKAARKAFTEEARAEYNKVTEKDRNFTTKACPELIFGSGKKDPSEKAQAWRNFYAAYTVYALSLSENPNSPEGKKAAHALRNLFTKCFGFTFEGKLGNSVSRKILNALGVKLASVGENLKANAKNKNEEEEKKKAAFGIAAQREAVVKRLLINIIINLYLDGSLDEVTVEEEEEETATK